MRPPSAHLLLALLASLDADELPGACVRGEEWCAHIAQERFRVVPLSHMPRRFRDRDTSFLDWERRMRMLESIRIAARER